MGGGIGHRQPKMSMMSFPRFYWPANLQNRLQILWQEDLEGNLRVESVVSQIPHLKQPADLQPRAILMVIVSLKGPSANLWGLWLKARFLTLMIPRQLPWILLWTAWMKLPSQGFPLTGLHTWTATPPSKNWNHHRIYSRWSLQLRALLPRLAGWVLPDHVKPADHSTHPLLSTKEDRGLLWANVTLCQNCWPHHHIPDLLLQV